MEFLLQDDSEFDVEKDIILDLLNRTKLVNSYTLGYMDLFFYKRYDRNSEKYVLSDMVDKKILNQQLANYIPVGNIKFISAWFKTFHDIDNINPIEVPVCLRTEEFLKRYYTIVPFDKVPRSGLYFIKDVSKLKNGSFSGYVENYIVDNELFAMLDNHNYQVSEVVEPLSEWRVYIISGKIESIVNYDGDPLLFPDVKLIQKANIMYSLQEDYPKSYSLDVMITKNGTSIVECHTFLALGLYSTTWGSDLLYAHADGIKYVLNHNSKCALSK